MMLAYSGVPHNLKLYSFEEWGPLKASGKIAIFGQLPSLELADGKIVSQSGAIIRYVAKLAGLVPADESLTLDADMLVELANDMNDINPLACFYPKGSEKFVGMKAGYFEKLPAWLASMARILADKAFFGGAGLSYGDFAILAVIDNTVTLEPNALDATPEVKAWYGRCVADPKIAAYLASRGPFGMPGTVVGDL